MRARRGARAVYRALAPGDNFRETTEMDWRSMFRSTIEKSGRPGNQRLIGLLRGTIARANLLRKLNRVS